MKKHISHDEYFNLLKLILLNLGDKESFLLAKKIIEDNSIIELKYLIDRGQNYYKSLPPNFELYISYPMSNPSFYENLED